MMLNCVDSKTNTLIFGHGGIMIRCSRTCIEFYGIKPPVGAGTRIFTEDNEKVGDWEYTGEVIEIPFDTFEEVIEFSKMCHSIRSRKGDDTWLYKGVRIDFSTYSEASMIALEDTIRSVRYRWIKVMAC